MQGFVTFGEQHMLRGLMIRLETSTKKLSLNLVVETLFFYTKTSFH